MLLEQELFEKFRLKLNENEVIYMKYQCNIKYKSYLYIFLEIAITLFTFFYYVLPVLISNSDELIFKLLFLLVFCLNIFIIYYYVPREIKNIKYQGFYITNQRLIAFNGDSFLLKDIFLNAVSNTKSLKTDTLNFFTKDDFIQSTSLKVSKNKEDELDRFLQTLYKISNNEKILLINSEKKGLNNGFDYYIYKKIPLLKR